MGKLIRKHQTGSAIVNEAVAKAKTPEEIEKTKMRLTNERAGKTSGRVELSPVQPEDFLSLGMLAGSKLLPKLLPKTFAVNPEKFYRTIGEEGFEDLQKTKVLRANPIGAEGEGILTGRPSDVPYFAKGQIGKYPGDKYVAEVSKQLYKRGEVNPVTGNLLRGRHGGYKALDEYGLPANIPIEDVTILKKNWLNGYKPITLKSGGKLSKEYIEKARKKAGGSNVGKKEFADGSKRTGPYAGPSGGAPRGSYPIPTIEKGRSALKLAHNAPNPSGIKAAVYRKYPQLKKKGGSILSPKQIPYPQVAPSDFAGEDRKYPIQDLPAAKEALKLAGYHGREDVKEKIYKRYPELQPQ